MYKYIRPYLYPKQKEFVDCKAGITAIEASTKSGKTVGCLVFLLEEAFKGKEGYEYCWVAPTYRVSSIAFKRAKTMLKNGGMKEFKTSEVKQTITLINGSILNFISSENIDSLYGEDYHACVIDEASRCRPETLTAIISTTSFTRAQIKLIGNVTSKSNWFYKFCRRIENNEVRDAKYFKIIAKDAVEAKILEKEKIDIIRQSMPKKDFEALYHCKATEDGQNPFGVKDINNCLIPKLSIEEPICFGIDLAKSHDYTVIIGLDINGVMCYYDRFRSNHRINKAKIRGTVGQEIPAVIDSTGAGDPILEDIQITNPQIEGYRYTNSSKCQLVEGLAQSIQSKSVYILNNKIIRKELENFEEQTTPSGLVTYNAGTGHDDCVNALALAVWKYKKINKMINLDCNLIDYEEEIENENWITIA